MSPLMVNASIKSDELHQGEVVVVEVFLEGEWNAPADAVVDQNSALFCPFQY